MEIKDIIDFKYKLIPDEYVDQILLLIQSNDENNWNLVYQLMRGGRANWQIESAPQAHKKEVCNALRACA